MKTTQTITVVAISIVATLAIAAITDFHINDITAEETEKSQYKTAEGLTTTVVFNFREKSEIVPVQTFTQTAGFGNSDKSDLREKPQFKIQKIPSNTAYLYEAADQAQKYRARNFGVEYPYKFFDVEVLLAKDGEVIRQFDYRACTVINYKVDTLSDKEEAYFGKGFATIDEFKFECDGYTPNNPVYDKMKNSFTKAKTTSSKDIKSTDQWHDSMKVD